MRWCREHVHTRCQEQTAQYHSIACTTAHGACPACQCTLCRHDPAMYGMCQVSVIMFALCRFARTSYVALGRKRRSTPLYTGYSSCSTLKNGRLR